MTVWVTSDLIKLTGPYVNLTTGPTCDGISNLVMSLPAQSANATNLRRANRLDPYIHFQSQIKGANPSLSTSLDHYQRMKGTTASLPSQTVLAVTYNLLQHAQTSQQNNWRTYFLISGIAKMVYHLISFPIGTNCSLQNSGRRCIE